MKQILLAILVVTGFKITAQDSTRIVNKYLENEFNVGYIHSNFNSLNSFFQANGMNPLGPNRYVMGFSTLLSYRTTNSPGVIQSPKFRDRFITGSYFDFTLPTSEEQPNGRKTSFVGYNFGIMEGFTLLRSKKYRIYFYVKLSLYSSYNVHILDTKNKVNAADILNNLSSNATLGTSIGVGGGSSELGISAGRMFPIKQITWDCPQNDRYMFVGLRVGYFENSRLLRYNDMSVPDLPNLDYKGAYVKLSMSWGKRLRQVNWQ